jgi:hypothetical protein
MLEGTSIADYLRNLGQNTTQQPFIVLLPGSAPPRRRAESQPLLTASPAAARIVHPDVLHLLSSGAKFLQRDLTMHCFALANIQRGWPARALSAHGPIGSQSIKSISPLNTHTPSLFLHTPRPPKHTAPGLLQPLEALRGARLYPVRLDVLPPGSGAVLRGACNSTPGHQGCLHCTALHYTTLPCCATENMHMRMTHSQDPGR